MTEGPYIRSAFIEVVTAQRIREYESKLGVTVTLPVPLEQIVEQVLGLNFDWDEIEEHPGERILGGLDAIKKKILLNEKHLGLFEDKPGLLRSTIGPEPGHYDIYIIYIDRAKLLHPRLPGMAFSPIIAKRHAKKSDRLIEVLLDRAATDPRAAKLLKQITEGQDKAEQKIAVDRWGLRGDPFLWKELRDHFSTIGLPEASEQFVAQIKLNIKDLTGNDLQGDQHIFVERYDSGGMPSGHVCSEWWRETGIPLLQRQYLASQRSSAIPEDGEK